MLHSYFALFSFIFIKKVFYKKIYKINFYQPYNVVPTKIFYKKNKKNKFLSSLFMPIKILNLKKKLKRPIGAMADKALWVSILFEARVDT